MFKFLTSRPLWVNILAGAVVALGLSFLLISSMGWYTGHGNTKTVPAVLGKTLEQAQQILTKAGFDIEVQDSVYIDTLPPLQVIRQVPDEMDAVKSNRTVYLTINRAMPPLVDMPNLIGYSLRAAELMLANNGLKLGDTLFKPDFAKNSILVQTINGVNVQAGAKVRMGSVVSLVIGNGLGDKIIGVPSLVGKTYTEAKALADSLGISFGAMMMYPDVKDTANAYIYRQVPDRFDEDGNMYQIRAGQSIDIWLSATPPQANIPATPEDNPLPAIRITKPSPKKRTAPKPAEPADAPPAEDKNDVNNNNENNNSTRP